MRCTACNNLLDEYELTCIPAEDLDSNTALCLECAHTIADNDFSFDDEYNDADDQGGWSL